jgi:sugar-specific transcriptional regulator TrmB
VTPERLTFEWGEMISALGRFGLSEKEADLYLTLIRRGQATARELTRERRLDRVLGYRLLEGLHDRGVLQITAQRPRLFVPISPGLLFERVLQARRAALAADEQLATGLADQLPRMVSDDRSGPKFQVLTGGAMLYPTLTEMVTRAQTSVDTMITRRALHQSLRFGLQRRIGAFLDSGGRFRLLVEQDPRLQPLLRRLVRSTRSRPLAQIRQSAPQPTRMTIVDGREILLYLVPEVQEQGEEVAIWTDTPEFVRGHLTYFNHAWKRSKPIGPE